MTALRRVVLLRTLFLAGVCGIVGCVPSTVTTTTSSEIDRYTVRTVAIVPFEALATPQARSLRQNFTVPQGVEGSDIDLDIGPSGPETGRFEVTTVAPDAAQKVTRLFYKGLRRRDGVTVLPPEDVKQELEALRAEAVERDPRQTARALARRLSADAALFGKVRVYRERKGSKIAASPAAVGFEVTLVNADDGAVLWAGHYYEEQKPMTEDFLGFLERKGQFLTAEELAGYGTNQVLQKFPFGVAPDRSSA